jgi:hypothetical protein
MSRCEGAAVGRRRCSCEFREQFGKARQGWPWRAGAGAESQSVTLCNFSSYPEQIHKQTLAHTGCSHLTAA